MTARIKGLTVVLKEDLREDDVEALIQAISMIKGVVAVEKNIVNANDFINRMQVGIMIKEKIYKLFNELEGVSNG